MTSTIPSPQPLNDPPAPNRDPQPPDDPQPAPAPSHNGPHPPQPAFAAPAGDAARADDNEHHEQSTQDYWAWRVTQRVGTNNGVIIGTLIEQGIRRLRGTTLTPKDITTHLRAYVRDPDDDLTINKILTERRVVVLTGADGSGRFSTALDVLHRRLSDSDSDTVRQIRQVRREPGDPFEVGGLHEPDTGWILDLRAENPPAGFGADLAADAAELTQGSLLVVLVGTNAWESCATAATDLCHALTGPPRDRILHTYLQHAPLTIDSNTWSQAPAIRRGIAALVPAQIAAWADAIVNTEEVERDEGRLTSDQVNDNTYFDGLVQQVVKAAEDWRGELLGWHTTHQDSDYRNYLLAAAVLEGARSEKIYEASTTLAKALMESPQPRPGQQGLGVVALTKEANADLQRDGTIRFHYHNYAEAVVDYFLDDRPHLLEAFTRWTADQVTGLDNRDLAERLAQRVIHWAVHYTARHRRTRLLKSLADQWSTTSPRAACDLLVLAAVDDRSGDLARNAYRRWTSPEATPLSADFTAVLIRACCRLAEAHPVSMLSRIAELASSAHHDSDGKDPRAARVAQAVSEALNTLWDDSQQRAGIHHQLTTWTSDPHGSHRAAAQSTFAHLAQRRTSNGPALLTDSITDTAWLTDMWRNALPTTGWSTPVADSFAYWMESVLSHPELRENIEQIVCGAVHRTTDPYYSANRRIAVQNLLYSWAPALPAPQDADATQLRDRILNRLMAQDPAAPSPADGHARHP